LNNDLLCGTLIPPETSGFPYTRVRCSVYQFKWLFCKKKRSVGYSVLLQSQRW